MSNSRNLADLLTDTGDVKSDALDNVPASDDASALTTGTLPDGRFPATLPAVSGASLTGIDSLPTQTSNSGKVLMSDGTDASWVSAGRKNLIINGGMDVWQRGTSGDTTGNPDMPTADRWTTVNYTSGWSITTNTVGKTMINDRNVYTYTGNSTDAGRSYVTQNIENDLLLKGKTVTISFWAKVSSGSVVSTGRINIGGGSTNVYAASADYQTIDTTWKKHTLTVTCGTTGFSSEGGSSTYNALHILTGVDLTGKTFYLADVQVELGSVATDFEHRSYGEELALCQRFYQKSYQEGHYAGEDYSGTCPKGNLLVVSDIAVPSWRAIVAQRFTVPMRTAPTITIYSPNGGGVSKYGGTHCATTSSADISMYGVYSFNTGFQLNSGSGGHPAPSAGSHTCHWTASAEL